MAGVFIKRGMNVSVPAGGLIFSIGEDGKVTGSFTLHVHFDVCPTWIDLSFRHLNAAKGARVARNVAWTGMDEEAKSETLEREFESSMQAMMAAAIALDAFYAVLQPHAGLTPSILKKWRENHTARYRQVTEVIRRAFKLRRNGTTILSNNLNEIYRYRNLAVHPSGRMQEACLHPELNVGVEWRFAYFHAANAELVVNAASGLLWDLCHNGIPANDDISKYVATLKSRLAVLIPNGHPGVPPT